MQRNHSLRLKKKYFDLIDEGKKTLEVRVGYSQIVKIHKGDTVTFDDYSKQVFDVVRVTRYNSFTEMLDTEDSQKIIPGETRYRALTMLQAIYPKNKEALGVYVFELAKHKEIKIISALNLVNKNHIAFSNIVAKAYSVTDYICEDYKNHFNWYWSKTVPAVLNGTREILVATVNQKIAGVAILKNEDGEQKICTFLVIESYRGNGIGSILMERAFKFLGTSTPLVTIADYKIDMFQGFIKKYGWKRTQVLSEGYYNSTSREIVFNGKIS